MYRAGLRIDMHSLLSQQRNYFRIQLVKKPPSSQHKKKGPRGIKHPVFFSHFNNQDQPTQHPHARIHVIQNFQSLLFLAGVSPCSRLHKRMAVPQGMVHLRTKGLYFFLWCLHGCYIFSLHSLTSCPAHFFPVHRAKTAEERDDLRPVFNDLQNNTAIRQHYRK